MGGLSRTEQVRLHHHSEERKGSRDAAHFAPLSSCCCIYCRSVFRHAHVMVKIK